jgi:hypothetical protein
MKPDYLWDKTGEPDPEIVRLEQVLGTLRYKPRPLQIPDEVRPASKRSYSFLLAIAAIVSIVVIAAGLWLSLNRATPGQISALELPDFYPVLPSPVIERANQSEQGRSRRDVPTSSSTGSPKRVSHRNQELNESTVAERKEAEAAKEQLMLALRLASSKLSLAQRKAQVAPAGIRNQHKVG